MKIYKKIIAIIAVITVLASSLLWLVPSASAYESGDTYYYYKLLQNKFTITTRSDYSFSCYITISTGLSGWGSIGFDSGACSYYVQIDKYAGSNGAWALKLDSSGYWKYRYGLSDYSGMDSTWHSMYNEPIDIYIEFGSDKYNYNNKTPNVLLPYLRCTGNTQYEQKFITPNGTWCYYVERGGTFVMPEAPAIKNYVYLGWLTDDYKLYYSGESIQVFEDRTYTIQWYEKGVVNITLDYEEAGLEDEIVVLHEGESFTLPVLPSVDGYEGTNWMIGITSRKGGTEISYDEIMKMCTLVNYNNCTLHALYTKWYKVTYTGEGFDSWTERWGGGFFASGRPASPSMDIYTFVGWSDGTTIYKPGDEVDLYSNITLTAVWTLSKEVTFQGEGLEPFTVMTDENGIVIMPPLPDGVEREGYTFEGWTEGAYIYKVGMEYDCVKNNVYTFTAKWKETGVGTGTGSDDDNFIVSFIFGTYDNLKEEIMPYLTEFEIPFLGITLADVVSFLFFGLIAWVIVIIVSKVIGK